MAVPAAAWWEVRDGEGHIELRLVVIGLRSERWLALPEQASDRAGLDGLVRQCAGCVACAAGVPLGAQP